MTDIERLFSDWFIKNVSVRQMETERQTEGRTDRHTNKKTDRQTPIK